MIGRLHLYASEACTARGWNWEAPSPVAQPRGSSADPPPPARPSRALACKQGVLGLGGRVGGGVGVRTPLPGHPWVFVLVRATSGGGGVPQRVRGCRSGLEGDGGGGSEPRRVMGPPRVVWVTGRVHPAFGQNASTTTTSWSAGACLRAPSQPVPRGPRVGGCPVHQWKRLSEQKIAFP